MNQILYEHIIIIYVYKSYPWKDKDTRHMNKKKMENKFLIMVASTHLPTYNFLFFFLMYDRYIITFYKIPTF
jgi:hypothetical protein